jgi:hypothetical protein
MCPQPSGIRLNKTETSYMRMFVNDFATEVHPPKRSHTLHSHCSTQATQSLSLEWKAGEEILYTD